MKSKEVLFSILCITFLCIGIYILLSKKKESFSKQTEYYKYKIQINDDKKHIFVWSEYPTAKNTLHRTQSDYEVKEAEFRSHGNPAYLHLEKQDDSSFKIFTYIGETKHVKYQLVWSSKPAAENKVLRIEDGYEIKELEFRSKTDYTDSFIFEPKPDGSYKILSNDKKYQFVWSSKPASNNSEYRVNNYELREAELRSKTNYTDSFTIEPPLDTSMMSHKDNVVIVPDFKPHGKTINECIEKCKYKDIKPKDCLTICENCNDTQCEWVAEKLVPSKVLLRATPDVESVVFEWNAPHSQYNITKYILVLQLLGKTDEKQFYFPKSLQSTKNSFTIRNLDPTKKYEAYLISRNAVGESPPSNIVSFTPNPVKIINDSVSYRQVYPVDAYNSKEYEQIVNILTKPKSPGIDKIFKFKGQVVP